MPYSKEQVLNKIFESGLVDLRVTGATLLANLAARGRTKTTLTTNINWLVNTGGTATHWESVTSDGTQDASGNVEPANIFIGDYRIKHQFPVSRVAIQDAKIRGVGGLADLFSVHVQDGVQTILEQLNVTLYNGTGLPATGNVVGLMKQLDPTYAYAGINPATFPAWKALQLRGAEAPVGTFANRAITKPLLMRVDRDVALNGTRYDFIVCSPTTALDYNIAFDAAAGGGAIGTLSNPDAFKNVDLGHNGRYYNTIPIVEDRHCPDGVMFFMNLSDFDVYTFRLADNPSPAPDLSNPQYLGLNFHLHEFQTKNSAAREFELSVYPQFRLRQRKSLTALRDLTVST